MTNDSISTPIIAKRCRMCGADKKLSEFNKNLQNRDGLHSYCRICSSERNKVSYYADRARNIARSKDWNSRNLDKVALNMRRCRSRNPEKYREVQRERRRRQPELVAVYEANKRAKRRAAIKATVNPITRAEWHEIKASQSYKCAYCGEHSNSLTMDHVIPLSKGGDHDKSNIVAACWLCNSKKTNLDLHEFMERMRNERA